MTQSCQFLQKALLQLWVNEQVSGLQIRINLADTDPACDFIAIRIKLFTLIRIRIRILLLIRWCESATTGQQALQAPGPILSLHTFIVSVNGPPWLHFESLKLLNFDSKMQIRIQLPEAMRIHVDKDPDPQACSYLCNKYIALY